MSTVHEVAYRLWQVRSINNVQTSPEQDWYDAERIVKQEEGHENLKSEMEHKDK